MNIVLYDKHINKNFWPLTATKAVAALQLGILTIQDWWHQQTKQSIYIKTIDYLQPLYKEPAVQEFYCFIDASVLPSSELWQQIQHLHPNELLQDTQGKIIAYRALWNNFDEIQNLTIKILESSINVVRLTSIVDLLQLNEYSLKKQFQLITAGKQSKNIAANNTLIHPENIFIEETAQVQHCIINATNAVVYIGHQATIMEGCCIKGSFALGTNGVVKMGAKIYGTTCIGNNAVAAGEIKHSIIAANSNKAHDGYLGDGILGEWCNLGAGTTNSNVKNNAEDVNFFNYKTGQKERVGKKMGVVIGDYSRTAINTSINTGSSYGVCCNIFGAGLLPTLINHFSWGTQPASTYVFDKAIRDIDNWKQFKGERLSTHEIAVLQHIFDTRQKL